MGIFGAVSSKEINGVSPSSAKSKSKDLLSLSDITEGDEVGSISSVEGVDDYKDTENKVRDVIEKEADRLFSAIKDEIDDDDVTDIEWDGYGLWITDLKKGCYRSSKTLDENFVDGMALRLSNVMGVRGKFSRSNPVLEANTDTLRISIWHESRSGRKSVAIRKTPQILRFDHKQLVESGYADSSIICLLENCVTAHLSGIIGGQPHAGKTELLKYLTTFIPDNEKAGVYEDNQEIHYHNINPRKKGVEFFVDSKYSYSEVIKAGLRHNVDWIILSESRGPEVLELINALSTGAYCLSTVHLEDVRRLPDRMYNMLGGVNATDRFINNVYKYVGWSALVVCDSQQRRRLRQLAFYTRVNRENKCTVVYEDGEFTGDQIPEEIMKRFRQYGIVDPYQ